MDMNQHIAFIVHLPGKPEQRQQLEAGVRQVLQDMATEPDFVSAFLHRSQEDPDLLVVYENWACSREEFLDVHLKRPYREAFERALPDMLKQPRTVEFLEPVCAFEQRAA
jgi:quinol monooxygenase YgiN